MVLRKPRQGLSAGDRGAGRPGGGNHQEALLSELGEAHQQGLPGRPLVCKGCGGPLKIVAYITDEISLKRILGHLGLSPPQQEKPPPPREVVRVLVDDEGREIQAG